MMVDPYLSIIIPAYNEALNIGCVLNDVYSVLDGYGFSYEVIVVDDGSTDKTAEISEGYGVRLISNGRNSGKGSALIKGFRNAKGDIMVTMDADGSHRAEDIPLLLNPLLKDESVYVTYGSRLIDEFSRRSTSELHLIGNRIINFLILVFTGKWISDSQSGFRAYRRCALKDVRLHSSRYDIESEMCIKLLKKGISFTEIPITCDPRKNGFSKVHSFRDGFSIIKAIMKATFYSFID